MSSSLASKKTTRRGRGIAPAPSAAKWRQNPNAIPPGVSSGETGAWVYKGAPHIGDHVDMLEADTSEEGGDWWPTVIETLGKHRAPTAGAPAPFYEAHMRFGLNGPMDQVGTKLHRRTCLDFLEEDFGRTWVSRPCQKENVGMGFKVPEGSMAERDGEGPGLLLQHMEALFETGDSGRGEEHFAGVVEEFAWCHNLRGEKESLPCHRTRFTDDGSLSWHSRRRLHICRARP